MNADEIRKWHDDLQKFALNPVEVIRARARIEIAAQLAEMNERKAADQPAPTPVPPEEQTARGAEARLRELCGSVYHFIGANMHKLGGCRRFLDALSNASNGKSFDLEHLLPYDDEEPVCMTDVAQPASAEPKGDVVAEALAAFDVVFEDHGYNGDKGNLKLRAVGTEAMIAALQTAFARIREMARDVAVYMRKKEDESESKFVLRVLDEAARRLGIASEPRPTAVGANLDESRN